jgi:hypothetical protein
MKKREVLSHTPSDAGKRALKFTPDVDGALFLGLSRLEE